MARASAVVASALLVYLAPGLALAQLEGLPPKTGAAMNLAVSSAASQKAVVVTPQVRAELLAHAPKGWVAGQTAWVGLQLNHQPDWHTYWKNSGDSGMPTQLEWTLPKGITAGAIAWPTPKKIPIGPLANFGYEHSVLLPVPLTVGPAFQPAASDQEVVIGLKARWLVCRLECIPEEGQFEIRLPLRSAYTPHAALFNATFDASPKRMTLPGTSSSIAVQGQDLVLQLTGLPAAWQGASLALYPETPELLSTTAPLVQSWANKVWTGKARLASPRSGNPARLTWVLAAPKGQGQEAIQLSLPIQGPWPSAQATPPNAPGLAPGAAASGALPTAALGTALNPLPPNLPEAPAAAPAPVPVNASVGWALALLGALVGGLLLNLMPCVFPILAIKALHLAQPSQTVGQRRSAGLAYTAGVLLGVLALGGALMALRSAGQSLGWGFQLQNPVVIAGLAALFVLIALNLLGSFEVGQWLPSGLASQQFKHAGLDAFFSGLLAVVVASPCSAPFMGAAMGATLTLPALQALSVFAALGLGLALPFLLVGFVPAVARWLPRPGAWMDTFKTALAFPMLATTVWLVWVLGQQNGINAASALLMLLVALGFAVWMLGRAKAASQRSGKALWRQAGTWLAVGVLGLAVVQLGQVVLQPAAQADSAAATTNPEAGAWLAWSPQAQDQAVAQGKTVFVDYTAAWCVTCQFNKKATLSQPAVMQAFQTQHIVLMRADWTRPNAAIAQSIAALGRSGVPVYVLQSPGKAPKVLPELLTPELILAELALLK